MAAKTVLITGCNRGIGLACVDHYKREGWHVIATARNPETAEELNVLSPWKLLQLDTSDESSIHKAAEELKSVPIDLLINNAGILIGNDLNSTTKEDLMKHFEVNTVGPFLMTRAFLPNLKLAVSANGSAIVVQVTSRMGSITDNGSGGLYGYRASKCALNMINRNLSLDLRKENITSLLLHPGHVKSDMTNNSGNVVADEAVAGMTNIIANAKLKDTGKYYHFQGEMLPW